MSDDETADDDTGGDDTPVDDHAPTENDPAPAEDDTAAAEDDSAPTQTDPASADEVPHDVRASLSQLLTEAAAAARENDETTAVALLDTAETVAENKLPPGERRETIRRGCAAARRAFPNADLAAAYISAAADRIPPE